MGTRLNLQPVVFTPANTHCGRKLALSNIIIVAMLCCQLYYVLRHCRPFAKLRLFVLRGFLRYFSLEHFYKVDYVVIHTESTVPFFFQSHLKAIRLHLHQLTTFPYLPNASSSFSCVSTSLLLPAFFFLFCQGTTPHIQS